jgi:hypothetical protein
MRERASLDDGISAEKDGSALNESVQHRLETSDSRVS